MRTNDFDAIAFYNAVAKVVEARGVPWRQVGRETGITPSTLSRMAKGRGLDSASLAKLSAWAGVNPCNFVHGLEASQPPFLSEMSRLLQADPYLGYRGATALEAIVLVAYQALVAPVSEPVDVTSAARVANELLPLARARPKPRMRERERRLSEDTNEKPRAQPVRPATAVHR
jgi:transcriptional regulator with XRE-family HTH domain